MYGYPQHDSALSSRYWMNLWPETPIFAIGLSEKSERYVVRRLPASLKPRDESSLSLNSGVKRKMLSLLSPSHIIFVVLFRNRKTVNT